MKYKPPSTEHLTYLGTLEATVYKKNASLVVYSLLSSGTDKEVFDSLLMCLGMPLFDYREFCLFFFNHTPPSLQHAIKMDVDDHRHLFVREMTGFLVKTPGRFHFVIVASEHGEVVDVQVFDFGGTMLMTVGLTYILMPLIMPRS